VTAARRLPAVLALAAFVGACSAPTSNAGAALPDRSDQGVEDVMKIRIVAGGRTMTAVLEDSAAARDFAALLPLELTLDDYNRTEKIADLPRRLATDGAPEGVMPKAGDIAYYAPWGNLAIFYRDFDYSRGLVRLGRFKGDFDALATLDGPVRIEVCLFPTREGYRRRSRRWRLGFAKRRPKGRPG
jgi:hypothetical protein